MSFFSPLAFGPCSSLDVQFMSPYPSEVDPVHSLREASLTLWHPMLLFPDSYFSCYLPWLGVSHSHQTEGSMTVETSSALVHCGLHHAENNAGFVGSMCWMVTWTDEGFWHHKNGSVETPQGPCTVRGRHQEGRLPPLSPPRSSAFICLLLDYPMTPLEDTKQTLKTTCF